MNTDVEAGSPGEPGNPEESSSEELNYVYIHTASSISTTPQIAPFTAVTAFHCLCQSFVQFQSNENESRGNIKHANIIVADRVRFDLLSGLFCLPRKCLLGAYALRESSI